MTLPEGLKEFSRLDRPLIIYMHPEDAKLLREAFPRFSEIITIEESEEVERGKCYYTDPEENKDA